MIRNADIPALVDTVNQHGEKMRRMCDYICDVNKLIGDLQGDGDFEINHRDPWGSDCGFGITLMLPKSALLPAAIAELGRVQSMLDELTAKLQPFLSDLPE